MPDPHDTDSEYWSRHQHGEEWEKQARDPDYGPITEEATMTERVDRETAEEIISTLNSIQFFDQVHDVDLSAAAKTLRALLVERDELLASQGYTYIGKDGKPILARDLEDQRDALEVNLKTVLDREAETHRRHDARLDALEAELKRFREERQYVVGFNDGWDSALAEQEKTDDTNL